MAENRSVPGIPGILLLDKPLGLSSNQALQRVRRCYGRPVAGHTGSLDPLASGMLPICLGEATKIAGLLLGSRKSYVAQIALGRRTATGDAEGEVLEERSIPRLAEASVAEALCAFVGPRQQKPPMYSAVHVGGERLYKLARQGIEVDRPVRAIAIHRLDLIEFGPGSLRIGVECSTGTYIRALGEEIAVALGTVGFLSALRRVWVEPFAGEPMQTLDSLEARAATEPQGLAGLLLPIERGLAGREEIELDFERALRLAQGQIVAVQGHSGPRVVFGPGRRLLGLGEVAEDGWLRPRRLFSWAIDSKACARQDAVERDPGRR
ncbi:MAG: tRNA pseudouridine(55) synthase TruB [Steroidobacteraceae bacterium]